MFKEKNVTDNAEWGRVYGHYGSIARTKLYTTSRETRQQNVMKLNINCYLNILILFMYKKDSSNKSWVTVTDSRWGFEPVFHSCKHYTYSTFIGLEKIIIKCMYSFYLGI